MYRKVVVPLDGSELAEGVLSHVAELIRDRGSQVLMLSVAPLMKRSAPAFADVRPFSASLQEERRNAERELAEYLRTVAKILEPVAADIRINVRFGRPADEILTFVGEMDADLIAMSTHGRSGISRWVFGSVTDRVMRGAMCPVLLVRAGLSREPVSMAGLGSPESGLAEVPAGRQAQPRTMYRRILVPLDGSELAEQALPYVKALIRPRRTSLQEGRSREVTRVFLISVLTTGLGDRTVALLTSYPPGLQLATTALHHAEIQLRGYLRSVAAVLREQGAAVHIAVRQGSPADEILSYAAGVEADLISMTTHGFSGVSRWVYGNVAGKVLQEARSPVLLVRPTSEQT